MSAVLHTLTHVREEMKTAVCSAPDCDCDGGPVYMAASPTWAPFVESMIDEDLAHGVAPDAIAEAVAELRTYFYAPWGTQE